ncbi:ion channel [Pontibacter chinhatensis]|uniref:Inward rectifier potassium channel n=1 Tax=Pontibacter chinhatensis TaxID=1436961 RepID=A0A1I2TBR0_9BACT|nr:ion channel [Pontibacter chinhatensis]SFG62258.1 inward rectifier potassium channel [Pontibacter chinhatensis]
MFGRIIDLGLGKKYASATKRLINKDGSFNIVKRGRRPRFYDTYQYLSRLSTGKLLLLILSVYLLVNTAFALLYLWCGLENLRGTDATIPPFLNAFFFSVQTFTTVGYGVLAPYGMATNLVVTLESLLGWVGFALIAGVVFGRFSRPNVRILYSNNAVIAPGAGGGRTLQFRLANKRSNVLMEMEARVLLMLEGPNYNRYYYNLKLEQATLHFFPLEWTVVHHIDEESPLYNVSPEQLQAQRAEVLISVKGYDEAFGQNIHSRFSYTPDEILWNFRFKRAYDTDAEGRIILNLHRLHETEPVF